MNSTESVTLNEHQLRAVRARDVRADGSFVYAVKTTGVYCRPSCPSRAARPENMQFHASAADAERAGFRPCRRCRPDQPPLTQRHARLVSDLCQEIARSEEPPSLSTLAEYAGMSPHHLHRLFKSITGVTPKAYLKAVRNRRLQSQLDSGTNITEALYAAGYRSSSGFYAEADQMLGMKAVTRQKGGRAVVIRFAIGECSLGSILVAQSPVGICAILLGDDPEILLQDLEDRFPAAELIGGDADYERIVATVVGFVENPKLGLNLPLDVRGTAFQQRVWEALQNIPAGSTLSYTEIAQRIGVPGASRAVAGACAANHIAVAIPCHRIVRKDGGLSGYRWGVERKRQLLEKEAEDAS